MKKTRNKFFLVSLFIVFSISLLDIPVAISEEGMDLILSQDIQVKESASPLKTEKKESVKTEKNESGRRMSLKDAQEAAFEYNRPFLNTKEGIKLANLGLRGAEAGFETRLTPSYSRTNYGSDTTAAAASETYDLTLNKKFITGADLALSATTAVTGSATNSYASNVSLSLTQPLLKGAWPLVAASYLADAERNVLVQELAIKQSKQYLSLQVISSYYQILNQIQLVDINAKSLERVDRFLMATRERLKVGLASQLDLLRAELQVSTQKQSLISTKENLLNQEAAFNILLGLPTDEKIQFVDEIVYQPTELDVSNSISTALENRSDYKMSKIRIEDMERQLKIRLRDKLPSVDLSGSYKVSQTDPSLNKSWNLSSDEWRVGLMARHTFPGTPVQVAYEQTNIALMNEKRSLEELRENIIHQVMVDIRSVTETRKRLELVTEETKQSEKRLKIAIMRYERGMADNLEVIIAEENLLQAKNNYSSTIANHVIAQSRLKLTMGVLNEE